MENSFSQFYMLNILNVGVMDTLPAQPQLKLNFLRSNTVKHEALAN